MKEENQVEEKASAYPWLICGLAALFYCYEYLLRIEPSVMVHQLMSAFHISASGLGLLAAMYYYAYTPLQAVVGVTTDFYGPKRALMGAIVLCVIGTFIFATTNNLYYAEFARFLIGSGSAFAFVGVLKLGAMWLPRDKFAMFSGMTTSLGMAGAMFGDLSMSMGVERFGWHRVIYYSAIAGLLLLPLFGLFVHDKEQTDVRRKFHVELKETLLEFLLIVRNKQILYSGIIGCILFLSLTVFAEMWGIPFIHAIGTKSDAAVSSINAMVFFGWLVGSPLAGWLSDKLRTRRRLLMVGSILAAITISFIILWPTMPSTWLSILLFLFGLFSSVEIICFAIANDNVDVKYVAMAMSVVNLLIMLGGMVIQPLFGWFLDLMWAGQMDAGVRVYTLNSYRLALLAVPISMLVAAFLSVKISKMKQ